MTINQYFSKVKTLFHKIAKLDPNCNIFEKCMKRIIIHGLKPEYRSFIVAMQGWPIQFIILELENLLVNQEALAKQLARVFVKGEKEALFNSKKIEKSKRNKFNEKKENKSQPKGSQQESNRKQDLKCYNYGKKGDFAVDYKRK